MFVFYCGECEEVVDFNIVEVKNGSILDACRNHFYLTRVGLTEEMPLIHIVSFYVFEEDPRGDYFVSMEKTSNRRKSFSNLIVRVEEKDPLEVFEKLKETIQANRKFQKVTCLQKITCPLEGLWRLDTTGVEVGGDLK
jgi:hypothetical protein